MLKKKIHPPRKHATSAFPTDSPQKSPNFLPADSTIEPSKDLLYNSPKGLANRPKRDCE